MKCVKIKRVQGFSLLELSAVLFISGLILLGVIQYYVLYTKQVSKTATFENIQKVNDAALQYYTDNLRYPCPTDPMLAPGDVNFGAEMCPGRTVNGVITPAIAINSCSGGLCRVESERDADQDGIKETVLIGAFPTVDISRDMIADPADTDPSDGIDQMPVPKDFPLAETYDGWNNKLVYAVTESQTDSVTFENTHGAITVKDEFDLSLVKPFDSAHYVVMSMGENARGAYTAFGNLLGDPCDPVSVPAYDPMAPEGTVSQLSIEYQNCNLENSIFISALKNDKPGDNFNDDIVFFQTWLGSQIWALSPTDPDSIYNTNPGFVGIGTNTPTEQLDILGRLESSDALVKRICDKATGNECFEPDALGGRLDGLNDIVCGPGEGMIGIENGAAKCVDLFTGPLSFSGQTCNVAAGEYVVGYTNKGNIICEVP